MDIVRKKRFRAQVSSEPG